MADSEKETLLNTATQAEEVHLQHVVLVDHFSVPEFIAPELDLLKGIPVEHQTAPSGQAGAITSQRVTAEDDAVTPTFGYHLTYNR